MREKKCCYQNANLDRCFLQNTLLIVIFQVLTADSVDMVGCGVIDVYRRFKGYNSDD